MEQVIGMSVVGCFKQVSIITSNNAFTPAHFPSRIGIVRVTSYSDRVFYVSFQPFSHGISPREWESELQSRMYRSILASRARRRVRGDAPSHHFRTIFSRGSPAR